MPLSQAAGRRIEDFRPVRQLARPTSGRRTCLAGTGPRLTKRSSRTRANSSAGELIALDFDRQVVAIAAQPFRLYGGGLRSWHVPDFFARLRDGGARVVDVTSDARPRAEETVRAAAATRRACAAVGWEYEMVGELPAQRRANLRWLAGFRRTPPDVETVATKVGCGVRAVMTLESLQRRAGIDALSRPVLFHLLWRGVLRFDLSQTISLRSVGSPGGGASQAWR